MKRLLPLLFLGLFIIVSCNQAQKNNTPEQNKISETKAPKKGLDDPNIKGLVPSAEDESKELFTKAATLIGLENYADGLVYISQYIEKNPEDANAYFVRGFAEDRMGDYIGALPDFKMALSLNPNHTHAKMYKGHAHLMLKQYPEAISSFSMVIKDEPDNMLAYYNRGLSMVGLQKYKEAIVEFTTSLKLDSTYAPAYNNRGNSNFMIGEADAACRDWKKSIRLGNQASEAAYKNYCVGDKAKKQSATTEQTTPVKK